MWQWDEPDPRLSTPLTCAFPCPSIALGTAHLTLVSILLLLVWPNPTAHSWIPTALSLLSLGDLINSSREHAGEQSLGTSVPTAGLGLEGLFQPQPFCRSVLEPPGRLVTKQSRG